MGSSWSSTQVDGKMEDILLLLTLVAKIRVSFKLILVCEEDLFGCQ